MTSTDAVHTPTLIERLEKAERPDIELGARIICFVRCYTFLSVETRGTNLNPAAIAIAAEKDGERFEFWANDPTASIDAALTLVPEDREWHLWVDFESKIFGAGVGDDHWDEAMGEFKGTSSHSSAIALCIAALKALAAKDSSHG